MIYGSVDLSKAGFLKASLEFKNFDERYELVLALGLLPTQAVLCVVLGIRGISLVLLRICKRELQV
jgi:hypothetical protein